MSTTHEDIQDLLGAYALDAVERSEVELVERHLELCPRCRAEAQEHREVAGLLGYAGQEAPVGLWDRIAASMQEPPPELRLERVARPGVGEPGTPWATGGPGSPAAVGGLSVVPGSGGSRPLPAAEPGAGRSWPAAGTRPRRRERRFASVRVRTVAAIAAAAAVVVGVLGIQVVRLDHRTSNLQSAVSATGAPGPTMAVVTAALQTPGARKVTLAPMTSGQSVQAVVLPDGQGYLYDARLTPLPAAQTYQLWGITGSAAVSYGLIGNVPARVVSFHAGPGITALALTAEVAGGVVQPEHTPVAAGGVVPPL